MPSESPEFDSPPIGETDKKILNSIQTDFPISPRPYQILADRLNLDEDELIERIRAMKEEMIIRRIGGEFQPGPPGILFHPVRGQGPGRKNLPVHPHGQRLFRGHP